MLFVVIHQAYELWFKVILHELDRAVVELAAGRPQAAMAPLHRTTRIDELLIAQLRVLETLTPEGFLEFRDPLTPASGLQSGQFRAIEVLGGLEGAMPAEAVPLSEHDRQELLRRAGGPNLYQALCACLRAHGFDAPDGDAAGLRERRIAALASLYRDHATRRACDPASRVRAAPRSRRGDRALALPSRADGCARDRIAARHRRQPRCRVSREHDPAPILPRSLGRAQRAVTVELPANLDRNACAALDAADPIAGFRERFLDDGSTIYLDGNSMGRLPKAALSRLQEMAEHEWGTILVRGWTESGWMDSPLRVGDRIGELIGAAPGEVIIADSTSVNLFKLITAVLRARPHRRVVLTEGSNFPTDLYIAQGVVDMLGCELRVVERAQLLDALDDADGAAVPDACRFPKRRASRHGGDERGRARSRRLGALGSLALRRRGGDPAPA